jgi:hypothetical protein
MSPQLSQAPQSWTHVAQLSSASQVPLPQLAQTPQSVGQFEHVSVPEHVPSPQPSQNPQSAGHVSQDSPLHTLSPHVSDELVVAAVSNGPERPQPGIDAA